MHFDKTEHAAKGKWKGILMTLGIDEKFLVDRHGPCPLCGGNDRFRWDNKEGSGSYICSQCGAGRGMKLAMEYTGKEFREVASVIDGIVGNVRADAPSKPAMTDDQIRSALRDTFKATVPVQPGDLVHRYLSTRHVDEMIYPKALRFAQSLRDGEGGVNPCMVAMVGVWGEKPCSMHRTFLRRDGLGKAEIASPRKMMPGSLPEGACVQLSEWTKSGTLGIAEGIETAMGASALYGIPVWAALNSEMLKKWMPPEGCEEVVVFGDNDEKFGGQAAAWTLAHRIAVRCKIPVSVKIPENVGDDWNDVWSRHASQEAGQ